MYLKYEFEKETGEGVSYLEGKVNPIDNGTYNDTYVEWLQKLVKKLMLTDVTKANQPLCHDALDLNINNKISHCTKCGNYHN